MSTTAAKPKLKLWTFKEIASRLDLDSKVTRTRALIDDLAKVHGLEPVTIGLSQKALVIEDVEVIARALGKTTENFR